jgi:hypothetical protein
MTSRVNRLKWCAIWHIISEYVNEYSWSHIIIIYAGINLFTCQKYLVFKQVLGSKIHISFQCTRVKLTYNYMLSTEHLFWFVSWKISSPSYLLPIDSVYTEKYKSQNLEYYYTMIYRASNNQALWHFRLLQRVHVTIDCLRIWCAGLIT